MDEVRFVDELATTVKDGKPEKVGAAVSKTPRNVNTCQALK